jgi:hypothetical protein
VAEHDSTPRDNPEVSHERSDVNVRAILGFGLVLLIAAVVVHLALYWLLQLYSDRSAKGAPSVSAMHPEDQTPPPPRLQVSPPAELAKMRATEEKELQTYGWVDPETKIVRIPIERAMELLAERGLPARKQTEPPPSSSPASRGRKEVGELN